MNINYNPPMGECQREPPVYFDLDGNHLETGLLQFGFPLSVKNTTICALESLAGVDRS
jgi:hypothetical protein